MSRTFAHVPFHHAFPEIPLYYARERLPIDRTERHLYLDAGPDDPYGSHKHWSKDERRERWAVGTVNRSGHFTRTLARQRLRAEIARQLADERADRDEARAYLRSFEDHADWGDCG